MRFDPSIQHKWAGARPVLMECFFADTPQVYRGIGASEGDPDPVVEATAGEGGIVDESDHRDLFGKILLRRYRRSYLFYNSIEREFRFDGDRTWGAKFWMMKIGA